MSDLRVEIDAWTGTATWTNENPHTRAAIEDILPITATGTRWGKELYATIPVDVALESGRETVDVGAIAYWPQGNALCVFWGETPASRDEKPRAASPVAVVARLESVNGLDTAETGSELRVKKT